MLVPLILKRNNISFFYEGAYHNNIMPIEKIILIIVRVRNSCSIYNNLSFTYIIFIQAGILNILNFHCYSYDVNNITKLHSVQSSNS